MTHVLVVDDEQVLRRVSTLNLTSRGYQVSSVGTGTAALQLAARLRRIHSTEQGPHYVGRNRSS